MLIQRHSDQVQSINGLCISKGTKVGAGGIPELLCAIHSEREKGEDKALAAALFQIFGHVIITLL